MPPKEADEGYPRQAAASDEALRATDSTSSVTASPCHLPLKGKAEAVASDEALRATGSTSSVSGLAGDARSHLPLKGKAEAVASDEALRATGSTSSVTASPCHLPLKGKALEDETVPASPASPASPDAWCLMPDAYCLNVLYCDKSILVCEKPVNCLSEPGAGANLPALAADWLRARGENPEIRTVHRLDKAVGGLTVLARTQRAAASLIDQISARTAEKEYLAVLRGVPEADAATLEDLLFHDSRTNKTFVVTRPRKGVRDAKLSYRVVGRAGTPAQPLTLVRVKLHTGRTHQIRAQFSHRGLPLLGDIRYGSKAAHGPALFSCRLAFDHPATGKRMAFELTPTGEPWERFN